MPRPVRVQRDDAPSLRLHVGSQETPMSKPFEMDGAMVVVVGPTSTPPKGAFLRVPSDTANGMHYYLSDVPNAN